MGPQPVLQFHPDAQILVAGQAPGKRAHETAIPFNDASGDRLRVWMGIDRETFYNPRKIAILPMGFCYPGKGRSGDLPPRAERAVKWRQQLLALLPNVQLCLVMGKYAMEYHLSPKPKSVMQAVKSWRDYWPRQMPLPHPSPRNNRWLRQNPWFEAEVIPQLQRRVQASLQ